MTGYWRSLKGEAVGHRKDNDGGGTKSELAIEMEDGLKANENKEQSPANYIMARKGAQWGTKLQSFLLHKTSKKVLARPCPAKSLLIEPRVFLGVSKKRHAGTADDRPCEHQAT